MADETRTTALKCLELLFSRFRQGVNFQALITKPLMEKLEADELEADLTFANRAASLTTSKPGAIPAMPTLEEVEAAL